MKFRKKPIEIEAYQFPIYPAGWITCNHRYHSEGSEVVLYISTLEGEMLARNGDWIIKGVNGEFYPCKNDIFEKSYEEIL